MNKRLATCLAAIGLLAILAGCNSAPQTQTRTATPSPSASPSASAETYPRLAIQAKELNDALLSKDLEKFLDLTHPKVIELGGGREKMRTTMKTQMEQTDADGVKVLSSSAGTPTQIIHDSGSIYAVLPLTLKVKAQAGTFQTESTLIGVSADNGTNWTFVDASGQDSGELKKVLPSVADKIKVPPTKQPLKVSD